MLVSLCKIALTGGFSLDQIKQEFRNIKILSFEEGDAQLRILLYNSKISNNGIHVV